MVQRVRHPAPFALRTPVGFDFTPAYFSSKWLHFGLTVSVIDPLVLDVSTEKDTVSADWKALLEPGAYVRVASAARHSCSRSAAAPLFILH